MESNLTVDWKDVVMIVEFLITVVTAAWGYRERQRSRPIRSMLIGIYNMAHGFVELFASEHGTFQGDVRSSLPKMEILHYSNMVYGTWNAFSKSVLGAVRAIDEKGEIWKEAPPSGRSASVSS